MVLSSMAAAAGIQFERTSLRSGQVFAHNFEFDLLLACCTDSSSHAHRDRIRNILSHPLDWERILNLVDHHQIVPQVYGPLSALPRSVPAQPLEALRLRYQDNAHKALWFSVELKRIVSHLESSGIQALPYKGPVLAETLYGDVAHRQYSDLDILIHPADVPKARATLSKDLGYKPGFELASRVEKSYVKTGYEYPFQNVAGSSRLELQWRILPRFYSIDFNLAEMFERADEISLGRAMRTLRAEHLLLILCVHAAKHVWVQLSWLCDIAQLVKSSQLDWKAIHDEARRLGIERIVNLNLLLAQKLLGSALSPAIQRRAQEDPSTTVLADEIPPIIQRSAPYDTESISYFRLMMRLRERWQDRVRFAWRLAFTPSVSEWSTIQLPKPLQPLYCLLRLSRLAKRLASADSWARARKSV